LGCPDSAIAHFSVPFLATFDYGKRFANELYVEGKDEYSMPTHRELFYWRNIAIALVDWPMLFSGFVKQIAATEEEDVGCGEVPPYLL
jgi:hypothetical protein